VVFLELDTEYRYWLFMEAHPTQNSLPVKAKLEAMDILTWPGGNGLFTQSCPFTQVFISSIEHLLPSHSAVPAPFTQEEC
jgi:hypothetical protein